MLISDWSSDVFSSDLPYHPLDRFLPRRAGDDQVTFLARGDFHELLGRFALLEDEAHVFHVAGEIAPDAPPHPFEGIVDSAPPATRPIDMELGCMRRIGDMRRDQFRIPFGSELADAIKRAIAARGARTRSRLNSSP